MRTTIWSRRWANHPAEVAGLRYRTTSIRSDVTSTSGCVLPWSTRYAAITNRAASRTASPGPASRISAVRYRPPDSSPNSRVSSHPGGCLSGVALVTSDARTWASYLSYGGPCIRRIWPTSSAHLGPRSHSPGRRSQSRRAMPVNGDRTTHGPPAHATAIAQTPRAAPPGRRLGAGDRSPTAATIPRSVRR